jgi:DNA-binding MarR family transcriptional regulator
MTALAGANLPITPLQIEIIRLLSESGELPITRISEGLNITKAQMTHLIDRLSEMEMVERRASTATEEYECYPYHRGKERIELMTQG